MKHTNLAPTREIFGESFLVFFVLFCALAISACGGGNTVNIYDNARVLNTSKVQAAAANLPNNVDIYTTNSFNGTKADFQRATVAKLGSDPNRIVMAIDTVHHYVYIAKGTNVPLSSSSISQTVNSFAANYGNGDYTRSTAAALGSMNSALKASSNSSNSSNGGGFPLLATCGIPLLLLGLLFLLLRARRPSARGSTYQPPQPGYPYNQMGNDSPANQSRGANPLAAGGLGAAAGGIIGYLFGKHQADTGNQIDIAAGSSGGGGGFGSGDGSSGGGDSFGSGGSNFGSGSSGGGGNFGSGGSDFGGDSSGGGGNFGSGGSDFGGGNSGGGGSFGSDGSDFGGGNSNATKK